ncbi:translation initiation factor IF-2 subunit beta [Candidatus Woesearchaeota archaeon]|nr:translation initiation factor IF-2 subunit beta [Candidatus Woesearchaeota archaeon]
MTNEYEEMLEKAKKSLPDTVKASERFVVPKVTGHIQGNKTIITNFIQIASFIHRKPENLLKYILKELATPGEFYKQALILGSKVPASKINEKIQQFVDEYVVCKDCGKPDTALKKDGTIFFMTCQACGAKYRVTTKF